MAHANGHAILTTALAEGAPATPLGEQRGLAIAGQPETEVVHPRRAGRPNGRRNYRTEALVSYLASRGKLPAEMLHDVLRQGWRKLATDLRVTPREAFEMWRDLNLALMPYTAPKLAALEISGDGAAGGLGAGALHLLAAQTMAEMMAHGAPAAPMHHFGAAPQPVDNAPLFDGLPAGLPDDQPLE
jgi:hypothetical protein